MGLVAFGLCMRGTRKVILLNYRSGASALTSKINIEERSSVIAYWLIPAELAHSFFQRLIKDLARRHNASFFEPHVTIYVGANDACVFSSRRRHTRFDCDWSSDVCSSD